MTYVRKCRSPHPTIDRIIGAIRLTPMTERELAKALWLTRAQIRSVMTPQARLAFHVELVKTDEKNKPSRYTLRTMP